MWLNAVIFIASIFERTSNGVVLSLVDVAVACLNIELPLPWRQELHSHVIKATRHNICDLESAASSIRTEEVKGGVAGNSVQVPGNIRPPRVDPGGISQVDHRPVVFVLQSMVIGISLVGGCGTSVQALFPAGVRWDTIVLLPYSG